MGASSKIPMLVLVLITTFFTTSLSLSCVDDHTSCEDWALQGECEYNRGYMHSYCPASCGRCPGQPAIGRVRQLHGAFSSSFRAGYESVRGEQEVHRAMARRRLTRMSFVSQEPRRVMGEDEEGEDEPRPNVHLPDLAAFKSHVKKVGDAQKRMAATAMQAAALARLHPNVEPQIGALERRARERESLQPGLGAEDAGEGQAEDEGSPAWRVVEQQQEEEDEEGGEEEGEEEGPGLLDWVEPRHIVYLYEISGLAQILSHALLLVHGCSTPSSLEAISAKTLKLQLAAVLSRGLFCALTHFGSHLVVLVEVPLALALLLGLLHRHARRPMRLTRGGSGGSQSDGGARRARDSGFAAQPYSETSQSLAADHNFPIGRVCAGCAVLALVFGRQATQYGFVTYSSLAFSIFAEAAALVPQRRLLVATARISSLTGHAVLLLALSRAIRLLMWAVLYYEGDTQHALMAADALHCILLGRFVHAYTIILLPRVVVPT